MTNDSIFTYSDEQNKVHQDNTKSKLSRFLRQILKGDLQMEFFLPKYTDNRI